MIENIVDGKKPLSDHELLITKEQLVSDLRRLGVREGDHLGLGISFRRLGKVVGGPTTLVDALRAAVGETGTIMIPTYTSSFPRTTDSFGQTQYYFDPATTPANTGIVAEAIRQHDGAFRSRHPNCSVAALGRLAQQFTAGHDSTAPAYLPYSSLAASGGKVLCIGIGDNLVGFRHEAQRLAGLLDVVPLRHRTRFLDDSGRIKVFIRKDSGGCVAKLPDLVNVLRQKGLVKDGRVGQARSILVEADASLKVMTRLLKTNTADYLCDSFKCLWCRELERRMRLYDQISELQPFQKFMLFRWLTFARNWLRLRIENIHPQTIFGLNCAKQGSLNVLRRTFRVLRRTFRLSSEPSKT
jgi:aminoglycoside 3-N-acetyltransferase